MTMTKEKTTPAKAFEILCTQLQKRPAAQKLLMAHVSAVTGNRAPLPVYHNTFCPACAKPEHCEKCGAERVAMYKVMVRAMINNDYSELEGQRAVAVGKVEGRDEAEETVATQTTTAEPPPETDTNKTELVTPVRRGVKPKPEEREPITIESEADDELTKLLIRRLAPHMPKTGAVDEERVKELIADEIVNSQAASESDFKTLALEVVRHALSNGEFPVDRVKEIIKEALAFHSVRVELLVNGEVKPLDVGRQHYKFPLLIAALGQRLNVALVGPAGSSKTTTAAAAAKALELEFEAISVGPMTSKADLLGFIDAHGKYHDTSTVRRAEQGGVMLWDEFDAANASVATYGNMLLANDQFGTALGMKKKHKDFCLVAGLNTFGMGANRVYVGRNQLDGATLDRFVTIDWDYDEGLEAAIVGAEGKSPRLSLNAGGTLTPQEWMDYVLQVRRACEKLAIRHIISPRATIHGCKLFAAGVGREHVESMVIWKGLDEPTIAKIQSNL